MHCSDAVAGIICHHPSSVAALKTVWLQCEIASGMGMLTEGTSWKNTSENTSSFQIQDSELRAKFAAKSSMLRL